ncbi:MAG TPA: bifunctional oligoribonuclease/PAP phosphatase NrnA [Chthoniobacterales bacterium]|nr:bifunctional oligoribonuclease/PAP phosphatase NrnA [Chthoniobacterales bacterium]
MTQSTFAEIGSVLRAHQQFAILSHVRPDGDALGSQLALALSLQQLGKDVTVWNEDGLLEKYNFLPGGEQLTRPAPEPRDFDVAIALDTATQNRLGTAAESIRHAKTWINIDHHPSNPGYGDLVYIDPSSPATGQILFELIQAEKLPMTPAIAENLFVAISTDTGSFQYPNTTARTFEIGAELLRCGVEVGHVSQLLYETYPRRRTELLRELLGTMRFEAAGKIASFSLSLKVAADLKVKPEDNEGLIDHLRAIEGVIVAIFFEELNDGKVRVSMRSKSEAVDVSAICQKFGGGGHKLAAGTRVRGTLAEVEEKILAAICDVIDCSGQSRPGGLNR